MRKLISYLHTLLAALMLMACQGDEIKASAPSGDNPASISRKTLIVYYSYTNSTAQIVDDLKALITADVIEVKPKEKGLDYAADNYALGSRQLARIKSDPGNESSYPSIDPVGIDMSQYDTIIIATPLWWSQMASNMQAFLFKYGPMMSGKDIGLVVSSHSSGISGVEADARRLVPGGRFFSKSLWINASRHPQRKSLLEAWLKETIYSNPSSQITSSMNLSVRNHTLRVNLADNPATRALVERLKEGAVTYIAHDYGGFEKVGALGFQLPSVDKRITAEPGDIMLYTGSQICVFLGGNSWEYTPIGRIGGMSKEQLEDAFGSGEVSITLSI